MKIRPVLGVFIRINWFQWSCSLALHYYNNRMVWICTFHIYFTALNISYYIFYCLTHKLIFNDFFIQKWALGMTSNCIKFKILLKLPIFLGKKTQNRFHGSLNNFSYEMWAQKRIRLHRSQFQWQIEYKYKNCFRPKMKNWSKKWKVCLFVSK